MNRAIAKVYAISITHEGHALTVEQKCRIADVVPELIAEIGRLEKLVPTPRGRMHSCDDPLCAVCGHPWAT